MSPLRGTGKRVRQLAEDLATRSYKVIRTVVGELSRGQKFCQQRNRKTQEVGDHEGRDARFPHINASVSTGLTPNQPAISVDTKTTEFVGPFTNNGRQWRPRGSREDARVHDHGDPALAEDRLWVAVFHALPGGAALVAAACQPFHAVFLTILARRSDRGVVDEYTVGVASQLVPSSRSKTPAAVREAVRRRAVPGEFDQLFTGLRTEKRRHGLWIRLGSRQT
jgi:hypothetical protein